MIRVVRDRFSFYTANISDKFLDQIADYEQIGIDTVTNGSGSGTMPPALTPLTVYQLAVEDIDEIDSAGRFQNEWMMRMTEDREMIINVLDQMRQTMTSPSE